MGRMRPDPQPGGPGETRGAGSAEGGLLDGRAGRSSEGARSRDRPRADPVNQPFFVSPTRSAASCASADQSSSPKPSATAERKLSRTRLGGPLGAEAAGGDGRVGIALDVDDLLV